MKIVSCLNTNATAGHRTVDRFPLWLRAGLRLGGCISTMLTSILLGIVPKFVQGIFLRTSWRAMLRVLQAYPAHSVPAIQRYRPPPQPVKTTTAADAFQHALGGSVCAKHKSVVSQLIQEIWNKSDDLSSASLLRQKKFTKVYKKLELFNA